MAEASVFVPHQASARARKPRCRRPGAAKGVSSTAAPGGDWWYGAYEAGEKGPFIAP